MKSFAKELGDILLDIWKNSKWILLVAVVLFPIPILKVFSLTLILKLKTKIIYTIVKDLW